MGNFEAMSLGQEIANAAFRAKRDAIALGRGFTVRDLGEVIDACLAMDKAKKVAARKPRVAESIDGDWLDSLEASPAYTGVAVRQEFLVCQRWCQRNTKPLTRRRFENWLGRADRIVGNALSSATVARKPDLSIERIGWQQYALAAFPGSTVHECNWEDLDDYYRAAILKKMPHAKQQNVC